MQSKLLLTNRGGTAIVLLGALLMTAGCGTTTYVLVGSRRPPISSDEVVVYGRPPTVFEEVAILDANSKNSRSFTEQSRMDLVIERLKGIAASVGANGILFQGASNQYTGSLGVGSSASVIAAPSPLAGTSTGTCSSLGAELTKLAVTNMGIDGVTGAMISRVVPNSPAAASGIRKGDIVLRVGDSPINDPDDVHNAICGVPGGSIIEVKVSLSECLSVTVSSPVTGAFGT